MNTPQESSPDYYERWDAQVHVAAEDNANLHALNFKNEAALNAARAVTEEIAKIFPPTTVLIHPHLYSKDNPKGAEVKSQTVAYPLTGGEAITTLDESGFQGSIEVNLVHTHSDFFKPKRFSRRRRLQSQAFRSEDQYYLDIAQQDSHPNSRYLTLRYPNPDAKISSVNFGSLGKRETAQNLENFLTYIGVVASSIGIELSPSGKRVIGAHGAEM